MNAHTFTWKDSAALFKELARKMKKAGKVVPPPYGTRPSGKIDSEATAWILEMIEHPKTSAPRPEVAEWVLARFVHGMAFSRFLGALPGAPAPKGKEDVIEALAIYVWKDRGIDFWVSAKPEENLPN